MTWERYGGNDSRHLGSAVKALQIVHLYAHEMNIYGDRGNIISLVKRLEWRGLKAKITEVGVGDKLDLRTADIVFGGGGQDKGQAMIAKDLRRRQVNLRRALDEGVVMLAICGTYQLFGHHFKTRSGQVIPGIGLFDAVTVGSDHRMIGNLVVDSLWGQLVGFENHSGQTELTAGQPALGQVRKGHGNNDYSQQEGAVSHNAFGTYMHGPLLPKNPQLADELLRRALQRHGASAELEPLDDQLEKRAASIAGNRPQ